MADLNTWMSRIGATFFLLVPILFHLSGCGRNVNERDLSSSEDTASANLGFSRIDSAGILISVTEGQYAQTPIGWVLEPTPNLVLGAGSDPSDQFFRIGGVKGFSDGTVLVVDGSDRELRFFSRDGGLLKRVGRKGEGPGEFDGPELVPTPGSDSLLFWDTGLKRFQVFSRDGKDPRTIRLVAKWPAGGKAPVGAVGHLMFVRKPEPHTLAMYSVQGLVRRSVEYVWFDVLSGIETRVGFFTEIIGYRAQARRYSGTASVPFASHPVGTVTHEAGLITEGRTPEIREYDINGQLRRIFRTELPGRPVTQEMIDRFFETFLAENVYYTRERVEARWKGVPIPDTLPFFEALSVDDVGWTWAKVYAANPSVPSEWMVFDPDGRAHGTIQTPAGLDVKSIGEDFLLGVWLDEFGVEQVHRHALRRNAKTEPGRGID